jgi:hypothetical protein
MACNTKAVMSGKNIYTAEKTISPVGVSAPMPKPQWATANIAQLKRQTAMAYFIAFFMV